MSMHRYQDHVSTKNTSPDTPIPGREDDMRENEAGGVVFDTTPWTRLRRFLILGSEGGGYYASERTLTRENARALFKLVGEDGPRVVEEIVDISSNRRAASNDPALFALAVCSGTGDEETRRVANEALPKVARIPTHLFTFLEYRKEFGGWGRSLRRAVSRWYNRKDPDRLAYHLIKYRQRNGWTHRDALLLAHVEPRTDEHDALYHWAAQGEWKGEYAHPQVEAYEAVSTIHSPDDADEDVVDFVTDAIRTHRLPRETIPSHLLNETEVWEALLEDMPVWALVRNLGKMTDVGLIDPMSDAAELVANRLTDEERVLASGIHPMKVLSALLVYRNGQGYRGSLRWNPVREVVDALDEAFYLAFGNVEPTGKRLVFGVDQSGSMKNADCGDIDFMTAAQGALAMALVTANVEDKYAFVGFTRQPYPMSVSPNSRLDDILPQFPGYGEGTNVGVPVEWALDNDIEADAFINYTDNQTWAGSRHPQQALDEYRRKVNPGARMVNVATSPYRGRVSDPEDPGVLEVVGFDTSTPDIISGFVRGDF